MYGSPYNPPMPPASMYANRLAQMESGFAGQQPQFQTIQTIQPAQAQVQTLFVNGAADLEKMQLMPNVYYIGINQNTNEVYIRRMNNDGITELNTYTMTNGKQVKSELQTVLDKLDEINASMKGLSNERNVGTVNEYGNVGNVKQPAGNGSV